MANALETRGYALFLMPSGGTYKKLSGMIKRLSREYSAPEFEPHVTLIGTLTGSKEDILRKTSQLAAAIRPFRITLNGFGCMDYYFRCLFLKAAKTPELMGANRKARAIFGRSNDSGYMPHLSLVYGNLPNEKKEEVIERTGKNFAVTFTARSMHLFSLEGEPREWYRVREFPLK
jgi:2'-5' RNA ligase